MEHARAMEPPWHEDKNPFDNAGCCSYLFFTYFNKLMAHGKKQELEPRDIPPPHKNNKMKETNAAFDEAYRFEVDRWRRLKATNSRGFCCSRPKYPSVVRTILFAHGRELLIGQAWAGFWAFFSLLTPFAVRALLKNITLPDGEEEYKFLGVANPWWLATIVFACQLMQSVGYNQGCGFVAISGVTMRSSLITAVYRKSLRLTSKARSTATSGEIINMMSNDAVRAWKACQIGHFAVSFFFYFFLFF